jgi:hypothetical protein
MDRGIAGMRVVTAYALARLAFGGVAIVAPASTGRMLAGEGGATADAQAFLRGIGGRELGIALGLLGADRTGSPVRMWLIAGVLSDAGDIAGMAGAWQDMAPNKRAPGLAFAGGAAAAGVVLLAARG